MRHIVHRQPRRDCPVALRGQGIAVAHRDVNRHLDAGGGAAVSCLSHDGPRAIAAVHAALATVDQAAA